jgi:hypothetical protein
MSTASEVGWRRELVDVTLDFARVSNVRKILMLMEDGNAELSQSKDRVRIGRLSHSNP